MFILFFVLNRDRRSAISAAVTFAALGVFGLALAPADSTRYWSATVFDTGRIGGIAYAPNQSITGALARLGMSGSSRTLLWLALSAVVTLLAITAMTRALRAGRPGEAVIANSLAGLLVSPISWSHHWVWLEPAVLVLFRRARAAGDFRALGGAGLGLVLLLVAPQWRLPRTHDRELAWAGWQQVAGSSYLIFAFVVLTTAAFWPDSRVRPASAETEPAPCGRTWPGRL